MMKNAQSIKEYLGKQFHLPEEQIEQMLPTLLATLRSHMANLQEALQDGNLLQIGKMGHTIKGAFLNLGLEECAKVAYEIEMKGKRGDDQTDYQQLYDQLKVQLDPLLADR